MRYVLERVEVEVKRMHANLPEQMKLTRAALAAEERPITNFIEFIMIVLNEWHLRRIIASYPRYYHSVRTQLSLEKDAPEGRRVQAPAAGRVTALPHLGGLHHQYVRLAA